jgi:hypothetical protein
MALEVDIVANARDFQRTTRDVAEGVNDVADSLDDLARDAQRSGDRMGDGITDGAREGERGLERLERSFRDMSDSAQRESRSAGRDIDRNVRQGSDSARDGIREIGDESASTAKEAAASFDGSAESIGDAFQEVAANAFAGFGPAGLIAGVAAAAGIGLVFSKIEEGAESTEAFKERVSELAGEFIETGKSGAVSLEFIIDKLKSMATETEDNATGLEDLRDASDRSGSSFKDLADAYSGSTDQLKELVKEGKDHLKNLQDEADLVDTTTNAGVAKYNQLMDQIAGQEQYNAYMGEAKTAAEEAAEAEANYAAAGGPEMELKAARLEALNDKYDEIAGSASEFISEETGLFDVSGYIASMDARIAALQNYNTQIGESALTEEAKSFLDSQGQDAAASLFAGYQTATDAEKAKLNDIWSEAGSENSGSYTNTFTEGLPDDVKGPDVKVEADTKQAEADIEKTTKKERKTEIKVTANMADAKKDIDAFLAKERSLSLKVGLDLSGAEQQISNFVNRSRTTTVSARVIDKNGKLIP